VDAMQCLGVHVEEKGAVVALVEKDKKNFVIKFLESLPSKEGKATFLHNLQGNQKYFIGSALETSHVVMRTIEVPLRQKSAIYKALPFQLEQMAAHSAEDSIVIPLIYKEKRGSTVKAFCSTRQSCTKHLELCQKYHIDPEWIGCASQALYRFTKRYVQNQAVTTLHMALNATHVIAIQEGKLSYAFQIDIGQENFFSELRKDLPLQKEEDIKSLFCQELIERKDLKNFHNLLQKFLRELDRLFYFLLQHKKENTLQHVFITREEPFLRQCLRYIENAQGHSLYYIDVKDKEHISLKPYAVAIGQALDVLSQDCESLQFRTTQTRFLQKKLTRTLRLYGYSFLGALCAVVLSWQLVLKRQESSLKAKLFTLLACYAQEIEGLSQKQSLKKTLETAEKKLSFIKKPYGYYSTPTRVQEFLEQLQITYDKENIEDLCTLQRLHYELVSYPSLQEPMQGYKIKVQLELESQDLEKMEKLLQTFCEIPMISQDHPPQIVHTSGRYEVTVFLTAS